MARPAGPFRAETAGSLTPELEGSPKSGSHPRRGGRIPERRKPHERH